MMAPPGSWGTSRKIREASWRVEQRKIMCQRSLASETSQPIGRRWRNEVEKTTMSNDEITSGAVSCLVDKINQHLEKSGRSYYLIGLLLKEYTSGKGPDYEKRFIRHIAFDKRIKCRKSTIYNSYAVMRFFPEYTPDDPLSFSHHVELTRLDHEWERRDFKRTAKEEKWSVRKLAAAVQEYLDETASAEKRLKKCLGCLEKSLDLLCSLEGKRLVQLAKGTVVAVAVVANAADEVAEKAKSVADNARKYADTLREQWEKQVVARQIQDRRAPGIGTDLGLEPCDYRLIGVQKGTDCRGICFPKNKPQTRLLNIFKATRYLLEMIGLADVGLQYRAGVDATQWNPRKRLVQFGEKCLEGQFEDEGKYRCRMYDRLGAKPGLDYVALTVIEEVTHAALDSESGPRVSAHGREFRLKLQEMYEKAFPVVMAILRDNGQQMSSAAVPTEVRGSTDACDSSADECR
jgi:hypothetical protein